MARNGKRPGPRGTWGGGLSAWSSPGGDVACCERKILACGRRLGQEKIGFAKSSEIVYCGYGWLGFCYLPYPHKAHFFTMRSFSRSDFYCGYDFIVDMIFIVDTIFIVYTIFSVCWLSLCLRQCCGNIFWPGCFWAHAGCLWRAGPGQGWRAGAQMHRSPTRRRSGHQ